MKRINGGGRRLSTWCTGGMGAVLALTTLLCLSVLAGCGGGGGGETGPARLSLSSTASEGGVEEGSGAVALTLAGANPANGAIAWSLSPAVGGLGDTSSSGASYQPPAAESLVADVQVTVTATPASGDAVSLQFMVHRLGFRVASASVDPTVPADVGVAPMVQFSRAADAATIDNTSVVLSSPIGPVPAALAASGATLSVTPSQPLVWGAHYTLAIGDTVRSQAGQGLDPAWSLPFDTAPSRWGAAASLASSTRVPSRPGLGFDRQGNAVAVWQQDIDGAGLWNVQAARFDGASRQWGPAVTVSPSASSALYPQLAVDPAGHAVAVWEQDIGGGTAHVWASRYRGDTAGWGDPVDLQAAPAGRGRNPRVAIDRDGNAFVVWQQFVAASSTYQVHVARYRAATSDWAPAQQLSGAQDAQGAEVVTDGQGRAYVSWDEGSGAPGVGYRAQAARFSPADQAWSAWAVVPVGPLQTFTLRLSADDTGNLMAVWRGEQPPGVNTFAARYDAALGTWGEPQDLATGSGTYLPQVQMDLAGNAFVAWQQAENGQGHVKARRYDAQQGGWAAASVIETFTPDTGVSPYNGELHLMTDRAGMANLVWFRVEGAYRFALAAARYDSHAAVWSPAADLTTVPIGMATAAIDTTGEVMAIWPQADGASAFKLAWSLLTGR